MTVVPVAVGVVAGVVHGLAEGTERRIFRALLLAFPIEIDVEVLVRDRACRGRARPLHRNALCRAQAKPKNAEISRTNRHISHMRRKCVRGQSFSAAEVGLAHEQWRHSTSRSGPVQLLTSPPAERCAVCQRAMTTYPRYPWHAREIVVHYRSPTLETGGREAAVGLSRIQATAKERAWCVRNEREFHFLWWDPHHQACPSTKKNT